MTARKAPHLLRVDEPPERFAALIAAVRAEGLRIGWLELPDEAPAPVPASLETAAGLGVLRSVSVAGHRSVALKPLKGPPVLGDLVREHFRGCALVLIRGGAQAGLAAVAALRAAGESWLVTAPGEAARAFATPDLAAALRRPRPWGPPLLPRPPRPEPDPRKQGKKRRDQRVKKAKERKPSSLLRP